MGGKRTDRHREERVRRGHLSAKHLILPHGFPRDADTPVLTRPVVVLLESLPDGLVAEDVEPSKLDALASEECDGLPREAALGCVRVALHEQHDRCPVHEPVELFLQRLGLLRRLGGGRERGGRGRVRRRRVRLNGSRQRRSDRARMTGEERVTLQQMEVATTARRARGKCKRRRRRGRGRRMDGELEVPGLWPQLGRSLEARQEDAEDEAVGVPRLLRTLRMRKVGTASMSNDSAMSGCSSASIERNRSPACLDASDSTT